MRNAWAGVRRPRSATERGLQTPEMNQSPKRRWGWKQKRRGRRRWWWFLTAVVERAEHGGELCAGAGLSEHAEAGHRARPACYVQGCVAAVVHQLRVAAGAHQVRHHFRLLGDHCQVQRSLRERDGRNDQISVEQMYFSPLFCLKLLL